jgi:hypothetical protein
MKHHTKVTVSGNHVEVLATEVPSVFGYRIKHRSRVSAPPERSKQIRAQSLKRTKKNLHRLINTNHCFWKRFLQSNYNPEFVTLTFKENMQDLDLGNRHFSKFIQRFNHYLYGKQRQVIRYVAVPEFQSRGAVHYHALFFDLPYIKNVYDVLRKLWPYGAINLQSVKNIDYIASYVCKYMVKSSSDIRLIRRKSFFQSNNLLKPVVSKNDDVNIPFINQLPNEFKVYEKKFDDAYKNKVEYRKYELPYDHPLLQEIN